MNTNADHSVLATVNAPYSNKLDAETLVHYLKNPHDMKAAAGPMSSFFYDVPLDLQKQFALQHGISLSDLAAAAAFHRRMVGKSLGGRERRLMASQWDKLLVLACDLIDQVNRDFTIIDRWTFGGGTAMMLQIDHRESDDVDIFLYDPQLLPYLDPARHDFNFSIAPSDYQGDGASFQKIVFDNIGEIDFIVCKQLTDRPDFRQTIQGRDVLLETIPEIICKKVFHRGAQIRPRDIFDIAAACRNQKGEIVAALSRFRPHVEQTIVQIERSDRGYVEAVIADLQIRRGYKNLKTEAMDIALNALRSALAR